MYTEAKKKVSIYVHLLITKYVLWGKFKLEWYHIIDRPFFFTIVPMKWGDILFLAPG